jgi:hypothetical protein
VAELAGPQMGCAVRTITRDVALPESVAAQNVVDAHDHGVLKLRVSGELCRGGENDQIVEDSAVGAPCPAVVRRVRLTPRLLLLQLRQLQRSPSYAVDDLFMIR